MGAALAFYTVFSIAPILIIAIGILGLVTDAQVVRAELLPELQTFFGRDGAAAVQALVSSASDMGKSRAATAIGAGTLLIGASTVFVELQSALDKIWGVPKRKWQRTLWQAVRARFLSLGLVLAVGFLLMVSLLVSTVLAAVDSWLAQHVGQWRVWLIAADFSVSLIMSTALFALIYKVVPQQRLDWRDVWVGGLVTGVLFNLGKFAIGYYLGKTAFSSVYGAVGSLFVLLLWTFYSAQIFLFGAELTKSYSQVFGTCAGPVLPDLDRSRQTSPLAMTS